MKLVGFRVQMFKSILDSEWVNVTALTVLVGKNEVGKTSLLKALHKFNPFHPEPYNIQNEWPRAYRDKRTPEQVVCRTRFELSAEEVAQLGDLTANKVGITELEITKNYSGQFEVVLPDDTFPERLHPNDVDDGIQKLPQLPNPVGAPFKSEAEVCVADAKRLAAEGRFTELADLPEKAKTKLHAARSDAGAKPQHDNENSYTEQFVIQLRQATETWRKAPTIHAKAHNYLVGCIPTFVYMDEYKPFRGTAMLDQVQQRRNKKVPDKDDEALLTILALSGLEIDSLVKMGGEADREERQYDLDDGASTLAHRIQGHWGQLRYDVKFNADGQQFFTFIRDPKDRALIKLEERSRGFQWFFSFDLLLMHQTKGTFAGCVILLDEPGLHLHPEGQEDLLKRLAEYANGNTLIYSTHLPFMIDLQEPDRIRVLSETAKGMVVTEDLTGTQPEGKLTLQSALGIKGSTSYLLAEENLVVEGVDDYWLISALSGLLARSGGAGLADGVMITPAGGASEVTYIATFMVGQELGVTALYDTDDAGNVAKDKFVNRWLTRYHDRPASALSLGELLGVAGECSIEDIFSEDYYLAHVKSVYEKQLGGVGALAMTLPPGGQLVKRVEAVFETLPLKFNKGSIAKRISAEIRKMKTKDDLPRATAENAKKLIDTINSTFGKRNRLPDKNA